MKELISADIAHVGGADGGFLSPTITLNPTGTDSYGIGVVASSIANAIEKGFEYGMSPIVNGGNKIADSFAALIKKWFQV